MITYFWFRPIILPWAFLPFSRVFPISSFLHFYFCWFELIRSSSLTTNRNKGFFKFVISVTLTSSIRDSNQACIFSFVRFFHLTWIIVLWGSWIVRSLWKNRWFFMIFKNSMVFFSILKGLIFTILGFFLVYLKS